MSKGQKYRGSFICDSCGMRKLIRAPVTNEPPTNLMLSPAEWRVIREFATEFDEVSKAHGERWEALDFLDWLEPSVVTTWRYEVSHFYSPNNDRKRPKDPAA